MLQSFLGSWEGSWAWRDVKLQPRPAGLVVMAGGGLLGVCRALWGQASPSPLGTAAELAGRPLLKELLPWVLIAWRELRGVGHRMGQEQAARALCEAVELGGGAPGCCTAQAESSSFTWE